MGTSLELPVTPAVSVLGYLRQVRELRARSMPKGGEPPPFCGVEDVILQYGRLWHSADVSGRRMEGKQCFANCQRVATTDARFLYVEGYALSVIPVHHAWLVDRDTGRAYDPTWLTSGSAYVGVPIQTDYLRKQMLRTGWATAVFDNWHDDPPQPILTGRHTLLDWLVTPFDFGDALC